MNNFASFLYQYRESNGLSREDVANIINSRFHRISGVDSASISMWERNASLPEMKKMSQVISALETKKSVLDILKKFKLPNDTRLRNAIDRIVIRKLGCIPFRNEYLPIHWFNDEGEGRYVETLKDIGHDHSSNKASELEVIRLSLNDIDTGIIIYSRIKDDLYIHYINYMDINALRYCLTKLCDLLEYSSCGYLLAHNLDQTMTDIMMLIRGSLTQRKVVMDKFFVISRIAMILNELDSGLSSSTQGKALS